MKRKKSLEYYQFFLLLSIYYNTLAIMYANDIFICSHAIDIATMNSNSNVTLSVTLLYGKVSYPGDVVTCICVTRGSLSIVWYSNEYIGAVGSAQVKFTSDDIGNQQVINSSTVATLVSAEVDNGTQILTSQLRITVSSDYQNPSVTCGGLSNETISFEVLVGTYYSVSICMIYTIANN